MKKKQFRKVNRSKVAIFFYYFQLVIVAPVLFPSAMVGVVIDYILRCWSAYKEWYLSKTLHR